MWLQGPHFLYKPQNEWHLPHCENVTSNAISKEAKNTVFTAVVQSTIIDSLLEHFSSLTKIKRILAYILRFIYNIQHKDNRRITYLSIFELNYALNIIIQRIQTLYLSAEIQQVIKGRIISEPLRKLNPFIDKAGILRVGGRLNQAKLNYDKRFPILLPSDWLFTKLLILDIHNSFCHPGIQTTHFLLFQNY